MTADPVAQIQSSRMVPAASVDAILGIGGLLGFLFVGRQGTLTGSPPRSPSQLELTIRWRRIA
jgi:hypothetical protein